MRLVSSWNKVLVTLQSIRVSTEDLSCPEMTVSSGESVRSTEIEQNELSRNNVNSTQGGIDYTRMDDHSWNGIHDATFLNRILANPIIPGVETKFLDREEYLRSLVVTADQDSAVVSSTLGYMIVKAMP